MTISVNGVSVSNIQNANTAKPATNPASGPYGAISSGCAVSLPVNVAEILQNYGAQMPNRTAEICDQLDVILKEIFTCTRDIIWFWCPAEQKIHFNNRMTELLGYQHHEVETLTAYCETTYFSERQRLAAWLEDPTRLTAEPVSFDHRIICKNGDVRWVSTTLRSVRANFLPNTLIVGTITDIDDIKRNKNIIREKTFRDPLTGLPNRVMLEYKLQAYMESVQRNRKYLALLHLDLDSFKTINEAYGYSGGDAILRQIGEVFLAELPVDTAVFRVGGDEFVILIKNLENRADLEQVLQNIGKSLATSIDIQGQLTVLQACVGISIYPGDGTLAEEIQNNAMLALKKAKSHGKGAWCYFNPIFKSDQIKRDELEKRLRRAIEKKEFFLVYQPQIDVQTCRISGLEALIRWSDPEFGLVSPLDFIPLAEECGLMGAIGNFVLETACGQISSWIRQGVPAVPVAVNISTSQFQDQNFFASLRRILAKTGLNPRLLELEITESLFLESSDYVRNLFERIRSLGIRIALDDFGSGYSSLTYLKNFTLDRLKIDRTFIHDMKNQSVETAITGTIVNLAHILNLEVVAEGVETREQFEYLKKVGCNMIQGFYFCKPVAASLITPMLRQSKPLEPAL